jgi:hypothetical protein
MPASRKTAKSISATATMVQRNALFVLFLLSLQVTLAAPPSPTCERILSEAYDQYRGLSIWNKFPKIGITIFDPKLPFTLTTVVPAAKSLWRFINDMDADTNFDVTSSYGLRINSINTVDDLWGSPALYASLPKLLEGLSGPTSRAKLDAAARQYLQSRIDRGAKIITSANFGIQEDGTLIRVAFVSPITKNIGRDGIPFVALMSSFVEVFTNMRIEDSELVSREFENEYQSGCLRILSSECTIFSVAREIYRHESDLKNEVHVDVSKKLCGYLHK